MSLNSVFKGFKEVMMSCDNEVLKVSNLGLKLSSNFALSMISFSLNRGEALALVAANGHGKSSLIRLITGLTKPDTGSVTICGLSANNWSKASQHIGYTQQYKSLPDELIVKEYLTHQFTLRRVPKQQYTELIKLADLEMYQNTAVTKLSGGNQRKLHILVAVAHKPDLLILDEPTTGLDATSREVILSFISHLKRTGVSIVFSTHHSDELEQLADQVLVLDQGRQTLLSTVNEFISTLGSPYLKLSLLNPNVDIGKTKHSLDEWQKQFGNSLEVKSVGPQFHIEIAEQQQDILSSVVSYLSSVGIRLKSIHWCHPKLAEIMRHLSGKNIREDHS
ncbi:ABC transporter ATP-binding protein [Shewanella woodyi]|uniref:ABC transporter ATP-binding protein n=1 Tax=Shewanella woodyi TaxID=60961 RepID=UPI0009ED9104|nr:ABC transporter ATP-binding protein [Shewanella woodyi]